MKSFCKPSSVCKTKTDQLKIEKGQLYELEILFQIYLDAKYDLESKGIYQWTDNYPTISLIESDLREGALYTLKNNNEIIGAIVLNEVQDIAYKSINWELDDSKVLVIHRLVIDPKHQGKGCAHQLMDFAENFAKENGYSSIRLDTYSQNERSISFYKNRSYIIRGEVNFSERVYSFYCLEKKVSYNTCCAYTSYKYKTFGTS